MSAEDASFNSWIKEYRPDENSINSQISYYDKGELLGMLLDLEIRRRSNNAKSLDDVMRIWSRQPRRNLTVTYLLDAIYSNGNSIEESDPYYARSRKFMGVVTYGRPRANVTVTGGSCSTHVPPIVNVVHPGSGHTESIVPRGRIQSGSDSFCIGV